MRVDAAALSSAVAAQDVQQVLPGVRLQVVFVGVCHVQDLVVADDEGPAPGGEPHLGVGKALLLLLVVRGGGIRPQRGVRREVEQFCGAAHCRRCQSPGIQCRRNGQRVAEVQLPLPGTVVVQFEARGESQAVDGDGGSVSVVALDSDQVREPAGGRLCVGCGWRCPGGLDFLGRV